MITLARFNGCRLFDCDLLGENWYRIPVVDSVISLIAKY